MFRERVGLLQTMMAVLVPRSDLNPFLYVLTCNSLRLPETDQYPSFNGTPI